MSDANQKKINALGATYDLMNAAETLIAHAVDTMHDCGNDFFAGVLEANRMLVAETTEWLDRNMALVKDCEANAKRELADFRKEIGK